MAQNNNKGKGWFGDSQGHSKAGRKGGLARGRNSRESRAAQNQTVNNK